MRFVALGILALAVPCPGVSAQENPYQAAHLRNLYVERRLGLEKAWAEAGEEDRERVRASARANKTGGQPALYSASAQVLTDARFMLEGGEKAVSELSLQSRVACSLDLMVLPGAFGAVDRDRGDALIIRVLPAYTRLYQRALPEQIQLTMIWVSPDGQETRARSEPVHRDALVLPGFEMYFHAPPSRPGTWNLIPEVEWGGVKGRGVPVPVESVRALFNRYDRLVSQAGSGESQHAILASLERILLHGGRDAGDPSVEKLLEGEAPARAHRSVHSWAGEGTCYQLEPGEGTSAQGVVVVVSPVLHEAGWALVGDEGKGWQELATAAAQRVILTELSPSQGSGPDVFDLLARLRREHPELPLTLVLHGSGLGRLQLSLMRSEGQPPFDRLVVDSVLWGAPVRPMVDVPMLFGCPLEEKAEGLQRSSVQVNNATPPPSLYEIRSVDLPVISGARLPGWIGQWFELLD